MYYGGKVLAESVYYIGQELVKYNYIGTNKHEFSNTEEKHWVYVLRDKNNEVKYVGRSKDPEKRAKQHKRTTSKKIWIWKLFLLL